MNSPRLQSRFIPKITPPAVAMFVIALLLLTSGTALATGENDENCWALGLGVGTGSATVDLADFDSSPEWSRGATPRFWIGRLVRPDLILGVETRQWMNEGGFREYKVRSNMQNVSLFLTWYPGRKTRRAGGLFVQGGLGYAHGRVSALEPIPGGNEWGETFETLEKHDAGGWGTTFGLGYDFAITPAVGVGISISYNTMSYEDTFFERTEFIPGGLNLSWYF